MRDADSDADLTCLREAIRLVDHSLRSGGGPFGAVVARDRQILGRGWNQVAALQDPTAHAEVIAIRDACHALSDFRLAGCVLYASCEPCPMCLAAAYWARVERIVYAASRTDAAGVGFDDAFIYDELARPLAERRVPMVQRARAEGVAAISAWLEVANRIPY